MDSKYASQLKLNKKILRKFLGRIRRLSKNFGLLLLFVQLTSDLTQNSQPVIEAAAKYIEIKQVTSFDRLIWMFELSTWYEHLNDKDINDNLIDTDVNDEIWIWILSCETNMNIWYNSVCTNILFSINSRTLKSIEKQIRS